MPLTAWNMARINIRNVECSNIYFTINTYFYLIYYKLLYRFILIAFKVSEYVYFNEPGYENTINTVQGQEANNAYSNIVKYGNIKYAM